MPAKPDLFPIPKIDIILLISALCSLHISPLSAEKNLSLVQCCYG